MVLFLIKTALRISSLTDPELAGKDRAYGMGPIPCPQLKIQLNL